MFPGCVAGRWVTLPSASLLPCACQNSSNPQLELVVGLPARAWQQAKVREGLGTRIVGAWQQAKVREDLRTRIVAENHGL